MNWVGNVLLPLYGAGQVVLAVAHFAGLLERMTIGEAWVRNLVSAMCCFGLSGLLRLGSSGFSTERPECDREELEMPLQVTPVNRNLQTRVTFMLLEFEDLFVVLGCSGGDECGWSLCGW